MRWIIFLALVLILAGSASAVIKDDASIVAINDKEAKFMLVNYANNAYSTKIMYTSKFFDWKDLTLADIDADNYNELVVLRDIGPDVYVYDYIDQELIQKFDPRSIGSFAKDVDWVKIIPINLDSDKEDELLLVNNRYGRFYYLDNSGNTLNQYSFGDTLFKDWMSVDPGDVDQDGKVELVMLRRNTQPVYVLEIGDKQLAEDFNLEQTKKLGDSIGEDVSALAVGDLNNDGKTEIIVADTNGKLYSLSYSNIVSILTSTPYKNIEDMDIADTDNDGKNELVILKSYSNPISVYKFYGETLTEHVVKTLTGEVGWIGVSAGNFKSEVSGEVSVPEVQENKTEEIPVAEVPVQEIPETTPVINEPTEEKTQTNYLNYILVIIILICIGVIIYLVFKFMPKSEQTEERPSKRDDKVYLENEEKESMWPVSKRSKDIKDLKELVKKTKK